MLGNYRVIRHGQGGDVRYSIHLVHYNEDGHPISCTKETVSTMSESVAGVKMTLDLMMAALHMPILDSAIFLTDKDKERLAERERVDEAVKAMIALPTWEAQKAETKRLLALHEHLLSCNRLFIKWFVDVGQPQFEREHKEESKRWYAEEEARKANVRKEAAKKAALTRKAKIK